MDAYFASVEQKANPRLRGKPIAVIGSGARTVITHIWHGMTLPKDVCDREEIDAYILQLSEMVGRRARGYGYAGKTMSLTLRYTDFETLTKQTTPSSYVNDTREIYCHVLAIFDTIRLKNRVRLIGVRMSNIIEDRGQMSLFEDNERRKLLLNAMDEVNNKYGNFRLTWASYARHLQHPSVISPAWRPCGVRNVDIR